MNHFKRQAVTVKPEEMGAIELCLTHIGDDLPDHIPHIAQLFRRRVAGDAKREDDATGLHTFIVVERLLKQNGVTANDLLPAQATNTGRF